MTRARRSWGDGSIRSNVISSQQAHERFGGVVPEIASRHHLELVNAVVERALEEAGTSLEEVELVAATQGPGLIGALLVGLSTGKAIAAARELPFAAVDHLQGHVAANFLRGPVGEPFEPPFICLIASGGHTLLALVTAHEGYEVLGRTLDDAAGEAFDKGARMLGLGFPGGPALERLAREGDPTAFAFPGSPGEAGRRGRGRRQGRSRLGSTSPSRGARPHSSTSSGSSARRPPRSDVPTSPPPTRERSWRAS